MKTIAKPITDQVLFTENGFTAEMCVEQESLEIAYHLRYRAYSNVEAIKPNPQELFTDKYDQQDNVRTYLIWYEGRPVASIRSLTWSSTYKWAPTDSLVLFKKDINQQIGLKTPVLESNRFVVDPEFKGRESIMAKMLLFRVQSISAQVDRCKYVITAVRPRHARFYKRFMNFEPISEEISVDKVAFPIQLLATPIASRKKLVESNAFTAYQDADLEKYINCLQKLNK